MDRPDDVHGAREFAANINPLIKFHGFTARAQSVRGCRFRASGTLCTRSGTC
jgi:hypothetical protein